MRLYWLSLPFLAACTAQGADQQALHRDVAGMASETITLSCPSGAKHIDILGDGFHIREGRTVYVCTVPLAGGLACTAGQKRSILDFEDRKAQLVSANGASASCSF